MRGTCVRVLAAALMTAAIAIVVGMSALFGPAREGGRPIAAPPSSLHSTVRLTAEIAPPHRQRHRPRTVPLVARDTISAPIRRAVVSRRLVTGHKRHVRRPAPPRELAAATTTTTAATTTAATPTPPVVSAPVPPPAPDAQPDGPGNGHGRGHAYGRSKQDD